MNRGAKGNSGDIGNNGQSFWQRCLNRLFNCVDCAKRRFRELRQHLLITAVFVGLVAAQFNSLDSYWKNTLEPRLRSTTGAQANIIAQSQTSVLVEILEHGNPDTMARQLYDAVQEMLVVEDPATGAAMVKGVGLLVDYDTLGVPVGTLDMAEGDLVCGECFKASLPLINEAGVLLGLVDFNLSDANYQQLAADMRERLFRESALVVALLVVVWMLMLAVFHRLHLAKRQIEESDRAKTRFMANVTHELRTPLNGILGYSQLMKADESLAAQHGKGIKTIDRCARHLLLLINDILDFSKADEEKLVLHPAELHLPSFLLTIMQMTEVRAREKGLKLAFIGPEKIPSHVLVDEKRLRQVALNLCSNALKFTSEGGVTVFMEVLKRNDKTATFRWRVVDTGIGIAQQDMKKIFVPFQQLDNEITRAEGSGLGLSICQRILQQMGSRLHVDSEVGKGSEFWFDLTLPLLSQEMTSTIKPVPEPQADEADTAAAELVLPPDELLTELKEAAMQHNILRVRQLLTELESESDYQVFCDQAPELVGQYRFKALGEWLASLSDA